MDSTIKTILDGIEQCIGENGRYLYVTSPNSISSRLLYRAHEFFNMKPNYWMTESVFLMCRQIGQYNTFTEIIEHEEEIVASCADVKSIDLIKWSVEFYDFIDEAHDQLKIPRGFFVEQIVYGQIYMLRKLFTLITNIISDEVTNEND